jgi:hypothetical protein
MIGQMGIDSGKGGGICFLINGKTIIIKMPDKPEEVHVFAHEMKRTYGMFVVFIEKVGVWSSDADAHPGKAFRIAKMLANYNSLITCFRIMRMPIIEVPSRTWQKDIKLLGYDPKKYKNQKNCWKEFAISRFGSKNINLKTGDACCIAWWGFQQILTRPDWVIENVINQETKTLFSYE